MKEYTFEVSGVCSQEVSFALDEQNRVHNVRFLGGCPGNLLAIGKLIEGADASHVATLLKGNDCGGRGTSCADQLSRALTQALADK
ncbi:MAG: TIGR03905 family TSCPD domain-containing protein [Elusimicrobiaceae bacterium]|nr:TIGR03905 family TSCPD domain-containing protein [Elusimicrobiaceae bacterium]MBP5617435.1 TIGR03905 family TSCPD domain-containing protein [Elusimicrobiaceae bacterium]